MSAPKELILLESGDHLSREEFHRRYCLWPDEIWKAELIGGIVYVASPARYGVHGQQQGWIVEWLSTYARGRPGVRYAFDVTVFLAADSEVQPDAILFVVPAPPGGARIRDDQYIDGAPQLVIEVAASSVSIDLHRKLEAYEQAGVQEYIVWRVLDVAIDWFGLREGRFERVQPDEQGIIESAVFPGLRLNVAKMLAGDMLGVLAELQSPMGA